MRQIILFEVYSNLNVPCTPIWRMREHRVNVNWVTPFYFIFIPSYILINLKSHRNVTYADCMH